VVSGVAAWVPVGFSVAFFDGVSGEVADVSVVIVSVGTSTVRMAILSPFSGIAVWSNFFIQEVKFRISRVAKRKDWIFLDRLNCIGFGVMG